jgi:hypothetical protein
MIEYDELKSTIINVLNQYLTPRQEYHESSIDTYSYPSLVQSFIPFSTTITSVDIYAPVIVNSPTPILFSILDHNNATITSTSSTLGAYWNNVAISTGFLSTKNTHYLKIDSAHTISAYVHLGTSTVNVSEDTLTISGIPQDFNLSYRINTGSSSQFVHRTYPRNETSIETSYPLITMDMTGRPRVNQRWLDPRRMEEILTVGFEIYSKYPSEIDILARRLEKGMFRERTHIGGIFLVSPDNSGPISRFRESIFVKQISFSLYMIVQVE